MGSLHPLQSHRKPYEPLTPSEAIASVEARIPINPDDYDNLIRSMGGVDYGDPLRFKLSVYRKLNQLLWEKKGTKKSRSSR